MSKAPLVIVGLGSQAKAWALNLKDSKRDFVVLLKENSPSLETATKLGFQTISFNENDLKKFDTFLLLIPDDQQLKFLEDNHLKLKSDAHLIYAHGYALTRFDLINRFSTFNHSLLAPKAIASEVRFQYETKGKIGAAYFTKNTAAEQFIKELAKDLGFTGLYFTPFEHEMRADLFSEQSLLCSILPYAALKSYNLLVAKGISKEIAFMECFLELRSISKALIEIGPEAFFKMISPNALVGSEKGMQILLDKSFDDKLEILYRDIANQDFYRDIDEKTELTRQLVLERWKNEDFTNTYNKLKKELI